MNIYFELYRECCKKNKDLTVPEKVNYDKAVLWVQAGVDNLNAEDVQLLESRYIDHVSPKELAKKLSIKDSTVRYRINKAFKVVLDTVVTEHEKEVKFHTSQGYHLSLPGDIKTHAVFCDTKEISDMLEALACNPDITEITISVMGDEFTVKYSKDAMLMCAVSDRDNRLVLMVPPLSGKAAVYVRLFDAM